MNPRDRDISCRIVLPLTILSWAFLVSLPVLLNWSRFCFNNYDLGIYAQALSKLGASDLNPWLTVRSIRVFNDHFDPILLIFSPIARWIEPSLAAIWIEIGFVLAAALWLYRQPRFRAWGVAPAILLLFSSATTTALTFPVHPATWSIFPLMILLANLGEARGKPTVLAALALLLFKEEYVPVLLLMGLSVALGSGQDSRQRRIGRTLTLIALAWGILVFILRPAWLGPVSAYGQTLSEDWLRDPSGTFHQRILDSGIWRGLLGALAPVIPSLFWLRRRGAEISLPATAAFAALFAIRLVSGRWGHHYWIPLLGALIFLLHPQARTGTANPSFPAPSRRLLWLSAALLLASQASFVGKYSAKTLLGGGLRTCPADPERRAAIESTLKTVTGRNMHEKLPILASGRLVPRLLSNARIHHLEMTSEPVDAGPFWILAEKGPLADTWPLDNYGYSRRIEALSEGRPVIQSADNRWLMVRQMGAKVPHSR